jgi:cytochrome c oxidase subunit 2
MGSSMTILKKAAYRGAVALASLTSLSIATAFADGYATPGQIGFEEAVTPIARDIQSFHSLLMVVITIIVVFVAGLLGWVMYRFNEKANPVPSKTTHHTGLEIAWTLLPVLILFVIAIPSMRLLTDELVVPKSDITLKVTGKQWFWSYEYPKDQSGGFAFDSYLLKGDDFKPGMLRQLAVDNEAVVPVGKTVHLLVTGADVIHSFTIPSFGVRIDAVPGRMNESWFRAEKEGIYYGQCSKICGKDHAYMPIAFKVVSEKEYTAWLEDAKKKFAFNDAKNPVRFAGAN